MISFFVYFFLVSSVRAEDPYRLPKNVLPHSYDLLVRTNVSRGIFNFTGKVTIDLLVIEETSKIVLHADGLYIDTSKTALLRKPEDSGYQEMRIEDQSYNEEKQFFTIIFEENLLVERYFLTLHFDGTVRNDLYGFYRSSYVVDNETRWIGVTQFSPVHARKAFPCMDEPGFKATFRLHLGHYGNETVSSNMSPVSRNLTSHPDYFITSFSPTPRISTYLLAWAIHDFKKTNSNDSRISVLSRMDDVSSSLLIQEGPVLNSALETWISTPNPINKIEQLAVPDFIGDAMENWGLIMYREIHTSSEVPATTELRILLDICHEFAHSWFGNSVTPEFWHNTWLSEGFATFFSYFALGLVHPDLRPMDLFKVDVLQESLLKDTEMDTETLNRKYLTGPRSITASFDFVPYYKGSSVISMIYDALGEDLFQDAVRMFLTQSQFETVAPSDLYKHFDTAIEANNRSVDIPASMETIMETYTEQPNYPVIEVSRVNSRHLVISQEPFLLDDTTTKKAPNYSWWVPLTIVAQFTDERKVHTEFHHVSSTWLEPNETINIYLPKKSKNNLYVINPNQTCYCRVNYDTKNWMAIKKFLNSDNFTLLSRASRSTLISDAFNLAHLGVVGYELPLSLAEYLHREEDYEPWATAIRELQILYKKLRDRAHLKSALENYIGSLIIPVYKKLKLNENSSDSRIEKLFRTLIFSTTCSFDLDDCVSTAKSIFDECINQENNTIPLNSRSFVYRAGIVNGTNHDWEKLWKKFLKTSEHSERELMLEALGCTENPVFVNKLIEYSVQPESGLEFQNRFQIIKAIVDRSSKNFQTASDCIERNVMNITNVLGQDFIHTIHFYMIDETSTVEQRDKLLSLIGNNLQKLGMDEENVPMLEKIINEVITPNLKRIETMATEIFVYLSRKQE